MPRGETFTPQAGVPPSPVSPPVAFNTLARFAMIPVIVDARLLPDGQGEITDVEIVGERIDPLTNGLQPTESLTGVLTASTDVKFALTVKAFHLNNIPFTILLGRNNEAVDFSLFRSDIFSCSSGEQSDETTIPKETWNRILGAGGGIDVRLLSPTSDSFICTGKFAQWTITYQHVVDPPDLTGTPWVSFASEDENFLHEDGIKATSFGELVFDPAAGAFVVTHTEYDVETRAGWTVKDGAVAIISTGEIKGQIVQYSAGGSCIPI